MVSQHESFFSPSSSSPRDARRRRRDNKRGYIGWLIKQRSTDQDVPLSQVLAHLSEEHDVLIILDEQIQDKGEVRVTVDFDKVSLNGALLRTLKNLGLAYVMEDDKLIIRQSEDSEGSR